MEEITLRDCRADFLIENTDSLNRPAPGPDNDDPETLEDGSYNIRKWGSRRRWMAKRNTIKSIGVPAIGYSEWDGWIHGLNFENSTSWKEIFWCMEEGLTFIG